MVKLFGECLKHIFERELGVDGLWETVSAGTRAIKTDSGLITVLHSVRAHQKRCNLKAHCLLPTQRCARSKKLLESGPFEITCLCSTTEQSTKSHKIPSNENAWLILNCFKVASQQLEK